MRNRILENEMDQEEKAKDLATIVTMLHGIGDLT